MSYWEFYNPNPMGSRVGDCAIRAISRAMAQDWETTYAGLTAYGYMMCDMPNANHVFGAYLEDNGYEQFLLDRKGKKLYTVVDFCKDNPKGTYILAIEGHVVCVQDGFYCDSWDSGNEVPMFYWAKR